MPALFVSAEVFLLKFSLGAPEACRNDTVASAAASSRH